MAIKEKVCLRFVPCPMSWSFTRREMRLPFHKTAAQLWKLKWLGFITENIVLWLPASKAAARNGAIQSKTAHRFPSSFWAGSAIQPAGPAEALHPTALQSLLAHAIRGLGSWLGESCCSHLVGEVSWACITCSLTCPSLVGLISICPALSVFTPWHCTALTAWLRALLHCVTAQHTGHESRKDSKTAAELGPAEATQRFALQQTEHQVGRDQHVGISAFWTVWTPLILPFLPFGWLTSFPLVILNCRPSSPWRWVNL